MAGETGGRFAKTRRFVSIRRECVTRRKRRERWMRRWERRRGKWMERCWKVLPVVFLLLLLLLLMEMVQRQRQRQHLMELYQSHQHQLQISHLLLLLLLLPLLPLPLPSQLHQPSTLTQAQTAVVFSPRPNSSRNESAVSWTPWNQPSKKASRASRWTLPTHVRQLQRNRRRQACCLWERGPSRSPKPCEIPSCSGDCLSRPFQLLTVCR